MKNRSSVFLNALTILLSLLFITGCATFEGIIELDKAPAETTWISPMNQDGIKDSLDIEFGLPEYQNLVIREYSIIFNNDTGKTVFKQGETASGNKTAGLALPASFSWKGVDQNGRWLPDGEYSYHIEISYGSKKQYVSPLFMVIIDNTAPSLEVSAAFPLFSPDGDGRLDTIRIFQRFSSIEEKWIGTISDSNGKSIKTFEWDGLASDFEWDGKDTDGRYSADGEYSYTVSSTDKAGNKAVFNLAGITVNTDRSAVSIRRDLESFSPNNDGKKDILSLMPEAANKSEIVSWEVVIYDRKNMPVRNFKGQTALPVSIIFDGKDNSGKTLPDGFYKSHLSVGYNNGGIQENVSQLFEIDTVPPLVNLSSAYLLFSPDGDGRKDTIKINQSTSPEELWTAAVIDSSGNEVRNVSWQGRAVQFEWDAGDNKGVRVADGVYSYRIESTDKADNKTVKELKGIRSDTRIPLAKIDVMNTGASPDGDGINDFISFSLSTDIAENIGSWSLEIMNNEGVSVKSFSSDDNSASVPSRIDWDGYNRQDEIIEDDYTALFNVDYIKGNLVSSTTEKTFRIDMTGPEASIEVFPVPFSPDQDGIDEILTIKTSAKDVSGIDSWNIRILDPAGNLFRTFSGRGELKEPIKWNGLSENRELVQSASDYSVQYTVTDTMGNSSIVATDASVDILVIRDGDNLKIIISSIYFVPNKADYLNLDEEKRGRNISTLDRLAEILKKYGQYRIRLEGHTARVYWDNPVRLQTEQTDVLLPLSTERAEVIKEALVARGINTNRLTTIGYGGDRPVVPHSDIANRWKNRRVEFILVKNN